MYKICIFAGTTEGRRLVKLLSTQAVSVTACVATEYGETLLQPAENLTVSAKRLTKNEMTELFTAENFDLVIDATHPYAAEVTEHIEFSCRETGTEYIRLLREESLISSDEVLVSDVAEAVKILNKTEGNILLTTGSKELSKYTGIIGFDERVYVRVLPNVPSLEACCAAGINASHTIAVQGPFSEEMNAAMLKSISAKYLVTKDGGQIGGFDAKASAAKKTGAKLIVIGRPPQREGVSFSEMADILSSRFGCEYKPCVIVAGIGPGGRESMTGEALKAIAGADCLIGAKRMLEAVFSSGQSVYDAISPEKIADFINKHREYQSFAIVMSGDVGFYSGAKKLLPYLKNCEVKVLPGLSSLVYLCAKLKISYEDIKTVSLHGREYNIIPEVRANRSVFALVGGENDAKSLCSELVCAGLGYVKVCIAERLSYKDEKITKGTAEELALGNYDPLSVVLIQNEHTDSVVTHGLPDDAFIRSQGDNSPVPMTKSEVRSVCLSKLRLTKHAVCWDVGAGTGSVAVEMAIKASCGQVYAIEKKASALKLLQQNTDKFLLKNITVAEGSAPEICAGLPAPTHAFIGGSSGNMRDILTLLLSKNSKVRIVAAAVSLETVAELTACMKEFNFTETEVVSMSVARAKEAGSYHLMTGQNPVYIFTMQNGGAGE